MRYTSMNIRKIFFMVVAVPALFFCSCNKFEGEQTIPSYISIDSIAVVNDPAHSLSNFEGCFTSNINAVQITLKNSQENHLLGAFELPCKVPVLREGNYNVEILPVIKQNGIAATRSAYPFYRTIVLKNQTFTKDSCVNLGVQKTYYEPFMRKVWEEYFEPEIPNLSLPDTIVRRISAADTVRSDRGCGAIYVKPNSSVAFYTNNEFTVTDNAALFLELDYWTNIPFRVGLKSRTSSGSNYGVTFAVTLNPNMGKGWNKIYIQLGKLWSQYNFYKTFYLAFQAVNETSSVGKVYVDNIKLTSYDDGNKK